MIEAIERCTVALCKDKCRVTY